MCSELSNYEKERDENVARNNKYLTSLGLLAPVQSPAPPKKNRSKTVFTPRVQPERESKRVANARFSFLRKMTE